MIPVEENETPWSGPVAVEAMAYGGKGIVRLGGTKVFFVEDAVPGDVILGRPTSDSGRYGEAQIVELVTPSPLRSTPRCSKAKDCGGCQWMGIAYEQQLEWKKTFVESSLKRIGKLSDSVAVRMHGSSEPYSYRNRVLVRAHLVDGRLTYGYFKRATRELVPIERCEIAAEPLNETLNGLAASDLQGIAACKVRLELQELPTAGGSGIIVTVYPGEGDPSAIRALIDRVRALPRVLWAGHVFELEQAPLLPFDQDLGLTFLTRPGQFQQVNLGLNRTLRRIVKEVADAKRPARVLDVCCGSGNLSLPLADGERYVEGVESNRHAITVARANADANGVKNATYLAGDAERHLWKCDRGGERFDLVLLDPPRQGLYKGMVPLKNIGPDTIVYVSCDPTTLARDLGYLCRNDDYSIESVDAFDFFPNTFHVETMVVLKRR